MTFLFNSSLPRVYDLKKVATSYVVVKFPAIIAKRTLITTEVAHTFICRLFEHTDLYFWMRQDIHYQLFMEMDC